MTRITVTNGETLSSVSLMYNVSPSRLQVLNNLFPPVVSPGSEILIETPNDFIESKHQISAILSTESMGQLPGVISMTNDMIKFKRNKMNIADELRMTIDINLISVIYTKLRPLEKNEYSGIYTDEPSVLTIAFLPDPLDINKLKNLTHMEEENRLLNQNKGKQIKNSGYSKSFIYYANFTSSRAELNALQFMICFFSRQRKTEINLPINISESIIEVVENSIKENGHDAIAYYNTYCCLQNIKYTFSLIGKSRIFDMVNITMIRKNISSKYRMNNWKKVYSISTNGSSYFTLYNSIKVERPCIFAILTSNNDIIGAYLANGIHSYSHDLKSNYFDSFVFSFSINKTKGTPRWKTNKKASIYRWSSKNNHLFYGTNNFMMIGCSDFTSNFDKGSALWIDDRMEKGYTQHCSSFDSPPLVESGTFEIMDIEIWEILPFYS